MALLGVDIGTSGAKALVFKPDGAVCGAGLREYPTLHPAIGRDELESTQVFEAVCESIRAAVAQATRSEPSTEILAMSFASMGEAVVPVDANRRILGRSILSSDSRGAEYVERLTSALSAEALYALNPNQPGAAYTMPKLCWLKEHEPELYERADWFLYWADLVPYLLGCDAVTNFTHANRSLLFDIRTEQWSDDLLRLGGLDRDKLAECVPTGTPVGMVSRAGAELLGLPNRPLVVAGAHDQCMNAVGAGAIEPGDAACGMGTVECIAPVHGAIPSSGRMVGSGLNVEHHAVAGRYLSFIYNQAGLLVRWFRDAFARDALDHANLYDQLFSELPAGPSGLLTLPYFQPTGAPSFISDASGAMVGLTAGTERGRILKSILECETFYFVESLSLLKELGARTNELVATGGGARSDGWLQIKADILGIPVVRLETTESGTLGAAIVAGVAGGEYASVRDGVDAAIRPSKRFTPIPRRTEAYREWYEHYEALSLALRPIMKSMNELVERDQGQ